MILSVENLIYSPSTEKSRVMVVDDDADIRNAVISILSAKYDVIEAENGDQALEILSNDNEFNVITLDLKMPGLSGIDTLEEIKRTYPYIEVLIVTAHSDMQSAIGALKYGAYDFIDKPFRSEELHEAVLKGITKNHSNSKAKESIEQLALVKAKLIESEKFSIISQLVSGVTQEINNPLTAIIGYSELIGMTGDISAQTKEYIEKIKISALLCKGIVDRLLSFSRKNKDEKEAVNINSVIKSSLELIELEINKSKIKVIYEPASGLPDVVANYLDLQQVFLKILNNSCYAVNKKNGPNKKIIIKTEYDKKTVRVIFQDNGPGIPEENLSRIFEPLFTTKQNGEGSGLGLSICFEIVKSHGGDIFAGNTGNGACFIVELPVYGDGNPKNAKS